MQDVYPSILSKTISDLVEEIISQNLIFISLRSLPWQFEDRQYISIHSFYSGKIVSVRNATSVMSCISNAILCKHSVFSPIPTKRAEIPLLISAGCSIQQLSPIRRGRNNESGERRAESDVCTYVYIRVRDARR